MQKNKSKSKRERLKKGLKKKVLRVFYNNEKKQLTYKQVASKLNIYDKEQRKNILIALQRLVSEGKITSKNKSKFRYIIPKTKLVSGKIDIIRQGGAYLISDELKSDAFIKPHNTGKALHGDLVNAHIVNKSKKRRLQAEVAEVVKRNKILYTGVLQKSGINGFLIADSFKMNKDVFLPSIKLKQAKEGEKVLVKLLGWKNGEKNPHGEVVKVFGIPGDHETEIQAIISEKGFDKEFQQPVLEEANNINTHISLAEIKKRKDLREITTFTIDPTDAKDFDDALSIRELPNKNIEIGVHIADVSHYVKPNSALDKEAYRRATSVYLVDRVIPMLPERLSNNICSLKPNEDKCCFSVVFEIAKNASVKKSWIGRTIINSNKRFTYEKAQEILKGGKGKYKNELNKLNTIAKAARVKRVKNGAISFDKLEIKFNLDKDNNPTNVFFKESKDAHKLVEEFMLLANKTVAEFIGKSTKKNPTSKTGVYRIHDQPNIEKLQVLKHFAEQFNYKIDNQTKKTLSNSINKMLALTKGMPEEKMIERLTIRSMAKAKYTTKNIGHYGLALDYYSHFTSPIRRYPDVLTHRLLEKYLNKEVSTDTKALEKKCLHSTEMEIKATEAERDSVKFMQVKFMKNKVNKIFSGVVSGVTEWGLYVEITKNGCEGMIRLRTIKEDQFYYDSNSHSIIGLQTNKQYKLGDEVTVIVKNVDVLKKQIDFKLI